MYLSSFLYFIQKIAITTERYLNYQLQLGLSMSFFNSIYLFELQS